MAPRYGSRGRQYMGDAPIQRSWFLGAASTLRGYPASTVSGSSFFRGRIELARTFEGVGVSAYGDAGWAGTRLDFDPNDILYGVGIRRKRFGRALLALTFPRGLPDRTGPSGSTCTWTQFFRYRRP